MLPFLYLLKTSENRKDHIRKNIRENAEQIKSLIGEYFFFFVILGQIVNTDHAPAFTTFFDSFLGINIVL